MQASNMQNVQKSIFSSSRLAAKESHELTARTTSIRMKLVDSLECRLVEMENKDEPAIMADMKLLKMSPNGNSSGDPARARADLSVADLKKIMRYMDPSKKRDVMT